MGYKGSFDHAMEVAVENNYYYNLDYMSEQHGVNLINKLLEESASNRQKNWAMIDHESMNN